MSSTSHRFRLLTRLGILSVPLLAALALAGSAAAATVTVFATGLNNPRGLEWGPDGNLYVAEGGLGGALTSTRAVRTGDSGDRPVHRRVQRRHPPLCA